MGGKPLTERSSSAQLWAEVKRLRKHQADPHGADAEETVELKALLERTRAQASAALDENAALRMAASDEGIAHDELAGKPALAKYRRTWTEFADAVARLPDTLRKFGMGAVADDCAIDLSADLDVFELDAPRGAVAAALRDRLRRQLTHRGFQASLAASDGAGAYHRRTFLSMVARYFFRSSVQKVYHEAAEEAKADRWGTVMK